MRSYGRAIRGAFLALWARRVTDEDRDVLIAVALLLVVVVLVGLAWSLPASGVW